MDFLRRDVLGRGRTPPARDDVESQSPMGSGIPISPQMEERPTAITSPRTRRFSLSRPTLPTLLRGRANAAASQQPGSEPEIMEQPELDSPKTPTNRYTLTLSNFSSSRLDLPHLASPTSTNGFRSPTLPHHALRSPAFTHQRSPTIPNTASPAFASNSIPGSARRASSRLSQFSDAPPYPLDEVIEDPIIARPTPAALSERRRTIRFEDVASDQPTASQEPQLTPPEQDDGEGGQSGSRRHRNRGRRRRHGATTRTETQQGQPGQGATSSKPRQRFLLCFPWIKSQKIRNQILTCLVSGMFLFSMLGVYLALTLTHQLSSSPFSILVILVILFTTIIFCHALIRLCLYVVKPPTEAPTDRNHMSHFVTPGGYAIPRRPIRVVLARDEEAAGIDSETVNVKPPAYGLWRESVRVDPNRIYWQRNEAEQAGNSAPPSIGGSRRGSVSRDSSRSSSPRPPSYASDDGIDYVVEARPRSMAPTTDVPLLSNQPGTRTR